MDEPLEKIVRELKDRQDILDCLIRYCRGVDRFDRELVASAYHPDALDDHGEFVGTVQDFIDWAFAYHNRHQQRTRHSLTNHSCEIAGDTAHAETYWTFTAVNREAPFHTRATGRYIDRLEKRDGRWGIAARLCVLDGLDKELDPDGVAGDAHFLSTARDRNDPSYQRPVTVDRSRITA